MNIIQNEIQNKRYHKKYKHIKFRIKSLILENAALCDEVAKIQENILIVKDERKFLLRKLLEYEHDADITHTYFKNEPSNGSKSKPKHKRQHDESGKSILSVT